ncbi:hypothetical protein NUU61_000576 [Penicillium alfredii]|uniref:Zn(2)-C6 fungal-type domain-containing protein n=1 Tax=Penicillium alfredii TaxID=1506179 RepID=A0A9W9GB26_9EURO|nr:uncharacterized protein NUU61_000576 [Penicillium alfredii]KAJ5114817.1 hypothetical protein NUU61_000576 [Penicillium alfredii]
MPAKYSRKTSGRRKTGCPNCRRRRIKCDEKAPCSYCVRRGLECNPPEFIVPERWTRSSLARAEGAGLLDASQVPESTYDVFQHAHFVIQSPARGDRDSPHPCPDILNEETAGLLRIYQRGIGIWMDIFDHTRTYQNEVVRCSLSSPLLMHAICAMSAKQMSLIENKFLWEPVASRFYGGSLSLLIKELADPGTDRELLLAATIILGSYELLAEPGVDYQKHLYGARTLIQSFKIGAKESRFEQASFWIYARQDVALALVNECPTLILPDQWPPLPKHADSSEEIFGNTVLQLLAKVIGLKFSRKDGLWSGERLEAVRQLLSEIESLWSRIPHHIRGIRMRNVVDESEGISRIWFCDPAAGN